jgi:hypothetical protein
MELRKTLGIPAGACGFVPDKSKIKCERWLLALLEVTEDGSLTVRAEFMPSWELATVQTEHRHAFEEILRRGRDRVSGILNPDSDKSVSKDVYSNWEPHIDYSASDGDLKVKLKNPSGLQIWINQEKADDDPEADGEDLADARDPRIPSSLRTLLRFPYWWHPYRCAVRRVIPGDKATAEAMLLLRGMDDLRQVASRSEIEDVDLALWWGNFQESITGDWPADLTVTRIPMEKMLDQASRSSDSLVVELVSEYL